MKPLLLALLLSHTTDAATTCVGLSRGHVERNPLMPANCKVLAPLKIGGAAVVSLALWDRDPRWWWKAVIAGSVAGATFATAHNAKVLR